MEIRRGGTQSRCLLAPPVSRFASCNHCSTCRHRQQMQRICLHHGCGAPTCAAVQGGLFPSEAGAGAACWLPDGCSQSNSLPEAIVFFCQRDTNAIAMGLGGDGFTKFLRNGTPSPNREGTPTTPRDKGAAGARALLRRWALRARVLGWLAFAFVLGMQALCEYGVCDRQVSGCCITTQHAPRTRRCHIHTTQGSCAPLRTDGVALGRGPAP